MHYVLFSLLFHSLWRMAVASKLPDANPELAPLSDDTWFERRSNFKRSIKSSLALQDSEHFLWGGVTNNKTGHHIYVNMTMHTADDELVISMERFANVLASVECDQNMMMTFKTNASYNHAIKSWDWVNFNENRTFIMIANYPGCGQSTSRQPWVVSNANYDPSTLTVHLNATNMTWQDVAHSYDLDFGQYAPIVTNSSLHSRDFGVIKYDKGISLNLAHSLPPTLVSSITIGSFSFGVGCSNCGSKGTLLISGHVETRWFIPKIFTFSANPKGIEADLNLKLKFSGAITTSKLAEKSWRLVTIPLGGFVIPGIITLGPNLAIDFGMSIGKLTGSATLSAGVVGRIPDSSVFEIDLAGKKASKISGWIPTFSSSGLDIDTAISASAMVFLQMGIALSLELLGTGLEVEVDLKVPEVTVTAALEKDPKGVCADKKKKTGVSLDASVGAILELQGETLVGGHSVSNWLSHTLFSNTMAYSFAHVCIGFGENV